MNICAPLALRNELNAQAATCDGERSAGAANPWGNSFPAEEFPFGRNVSVGGFDFAIPRPGSGGNDNIELRGQGLSLPPVVIVGIAALGYAEMGPRRWTLWLENRDEEGEATELVAPGWLTEPHATDAACQLACSHLHYPGDYELGALRPAAWAMAVHLSPQRASILRLSASPLVHLFAISLLVGGVA